MGEIKISPDYNWFRSTVPLKKVRSVFNLPGKESILGYLAYGGASGTANSAPLLSTGNMVYQTLKLEEYFVAILC